MQKNEPFLPISKPLQSLLYWISNGDRSQAWKARGIEMPCLEAQNDSCTFDWGLTHGSVLSFNLFMRLQDNQKQNASPSHPVRNYSHSYVVPC
jgi:hypothetical protein